MSARAQGVTYATLSPHTCYSKGCSHEECRAARAEAKREAKRRRSRPDAVPAPVRVPTGQVRTHLAELRASGLGVPEIARRSGLSSRHVWRIASGEVAKVNPETKRRLLAVHAGELAANALVKAQDVQRRLLELYRLGWSAEQVASVLGLSVWTVRRIPDRHMVTWRVARAVATLHAELCPSEQMLVEDWEDLLRTVIGDADRRWMVDAECRRLDGTPRDRVNVFFPGRGERVDPAREVCARCPVIDQCREYVDQVDGGGIYIGIFAGMTGAERREGMRES